MAKPEKQYGVSPVETFLREYETLQKMEALMVKVRGKYTQYTGEDLYQQCKREYEGEYYGLDEVDGLREAEAEVRAYFDMVARELEEGLQ